VHLLVLVILVVPMNTVACWMEKMTQQTRVFIWASLSTAQSYLLPGRPIHSYSISTFL